MYSSIVVLNNDKNNHLNECLNSIYNQTFKNYEVILVNNDFSKQTLKIIYEYKKKIKNLIVINKDFKSIGKIKNYTVENCSGKNIMFLDSNQILDPIALYNINLRMISDNVKITRLTNQRAKYNYKLYKMGINYGNKIINVKKDKNYICDYDLRFNREMYDAQFLKKHKFCENCKHENTVSIPLLLVKAGKVANINDSLIHFKKNYYKEIKEITNSKMDCYSIFEDLKLLENYFNALNLYDEYKKEIKNIFIRSSLITMKKIVKNINIDKYKKEFLIKDIVLLMNKRDKHWKQSDIVKLNKKNSFMFNLFFRRVNYLNSYNDYSKNILNDDYVTIENIKKYIKEG